MKKYLIYSLLIAFTATLTFTGCKETNTGGEAVAYETLTAHLKSIDMDLNHVIKNADGQKFVMGAPADGNVSGKYVMDIRSATDFAAGHIEGANNVKFTDIVS